MAGTISFTEFRTPTQEKEENVYFPPPLEIPKKRIKQKEINGIDGTKRIKCDGYGVCHDEEGNRVDKNGRRMQSVSIRNQDMEVRMKKEKEAKANRRVIIPNYKPDMRVLDFLTSAGLLNPALRTLYRRK